MVKNKDAFRALPIKERAALINKYVSGGIMDLAEMKRHYNSFDTGGDTDGDGNIVLDWIRKQLYDKIDPVGYNQFVDRVKAAILGKGEDRYNKARDDIFATYLKIPKDERHNVEDAKKVSDATYTPTKSSEDTNYHKIDLTNKEKDALIYDALRSNANVGDSSRSHVLEQFFGPHQVSRGKDEKGEYVSYYDLWDLDPSSGESKTGEFEFLKSLQELLGAKDMSLGIGEPVEFYDRIYLNDYYGVTPKIDEGVIEGGYIQPAYIEASAGTSSTLTGEDYYDAGETSLPTYSKGGKLNIFGGGGPTREMTTSEAKAINKTLNKSQYMLAVGDSPDDPAYLSTDELQPAVVIAEAKKPTNEETEQNKRNFAKQIRNRSLVGHIGTGLGLDLGDKSLQNIAATAIGIPLTATNPVTTTLIKPLIKGIGHIGKVLLDPSKALTGVGQAASTTADVYGTIEGLRHIPTAAKNIMQGDATGIDYFNLATGLMGPFGTFNTVKGIKNINSFKSPLFDYTTHNINVQQANNNYKANKINVPQSVTESFDNSSYAYNYLLNADNYLTKHDINKLRYLISKSISKYNPTIQKDILEDPNLLDRLASSYRAFGDSKDAQYHIDLVIKQKFGVNGDFPKTIEDVYFNDPKRYQSITRIVKPLEETVEKTNALRISKLRPSLQEIVKLVPDYLNEIEEYANLGLNDEDIVKKILEQRFTFYRGFATDNSVPTQNLIQIPIKSSAGRADRQVFGELADNEDVGYLSNSLETAIAYSYPEVSQFPNKIVGLIKRKPETFDFTGTPLDWIKNNTLDKLNIKKALSTHNIEDDVLKNFIKNLEKHGINNLNFKNYKTNRFLQELYTRVNNPKLNDNYFSHFLLKGKKGELYKDLYIDELYKIPYIYGLQDISELEKLFNTKLNKKAITRFHYGVSTPKASKNKNGGFLTKK